MKRIITLLLVITLLLACTPAMAQYRKYESLYFDASVMLPDYLDVIFETRDRTGAVSIYFLMPEEDAEIVATLTYIPDFAGMKTADLPKEEIEGWKEFFTELYPKHSKSSLIKASYSSSRRIYRYYGMSEKGKWMLNYTGVQDGMYVSVCCETNRFGYKKTVMKAIFEVFNNCFELFAKSRGVDFTPFNPDDYEVEIFKLLYDDSPDSIFRTY